MAIVHEQMVLLAFFSLHFEKKKKGRNYGYLYFLCRGEFAFCSKECRQQLIAKEEHRHKFERWLQTLLKSYSPLAVEASGFEFNLQI